MVYSVDIDNMLRYRKGRVSGTIKVEETSISQDEALAMGDIVIAGVPTPKFSVDPKKLKNGCIAVNFSQFANFGDGTEDVATFVPAIGKVTIAMLERNLLRLHSAAIASDAAASARSKCSAVVTAALVAVAAIGVVRALR
jgi:methylenetetrahydrofolate dehydrogenase (NAD+)